MTMSWRSDGVDQSTTTAAALYGLSTSSTGPINMEGKLDDSHDNLLPPHQACESTTASSSSAASSPIGLDDDTTTTALNTTIKSLAATTTTTADQASTTSAGLMRDHQQPASSSIDNDYDQQQLQQQHQQDHHDQSHSSSIDGRSSPKNMLIGGSVSLTTTAAAATNPSGYNDLDNVDAYNRLSFLPHSSGGDHDGGGGGGNQEQHHDDDEGDDYDDYDDDDEDDDDDDEADHTLSQRPHELHQGQQQQSLSGLTLSNSRNNNNSISQMSSSSYSSSSKPLQDDRVIPDDDTDGVDQEIPWKPQDTQSVCEFTHTITEYSTKRDSGCKKAEYSATTVDNLGNKWRLIVYVNGNGRASNHHLSLFLQVADADDLPFGWKKAVSYVLTLEHPSGANLSYAKRNPDKTFKLCPKAIDWGWSQFITSDRIQQEGFVQNDALVVRASVTVKSSSVNIDIEDAELYLKCAVEEGKPDAVQLCLDQGATVNCQFKDDLYTPLHTACSATPADDSSDGDNSKSASSIQGSMQVLELLLEKGADGNACNKWRETPLLIAANNGHRAAVEALLDHDADPSLCSEAGWSALTFAAHKGYDDIVALLLEKGAPVNCLVTEDASTPLHKACAGSKPGHLLAVNLLLKSDADVHALNKWRETPLLTAANHGQAGAVEALLKAGADPCKCTDTGWSPLSIAAYKGHDDVVKLLLEEGAPTEEADPTLSALLQAATKGLPDTVGLLLRHGADHTVTTKKGDTALSILVEQNLIDAAVEMVTEYKASVPRCSRDRKKVQRARLLINLRLKQQQRDDLNLGSDDDDDDESVTNDATPVVVSVVDDTESSVPRQGKKKSKKKKVSAEQQAKQAEEALLLELEQEDAERHKQEEEAKKKSAKKKNKKERERQQKKDVEERRLAEERVIEETRRKEREAKEAVERAERERIAAIKKKEEDDIRGKQQQAIQQEQQKELELRKKLQKKEDDRKAAQHNKLVEHNAKNGQHTPTGQAKANKSAKGAPKVPKNQQAYVRSTTSNVPVAGTTTEIMAASTPLTSSGERNPPGKRRGWESLPGAGPGQKPARHDPTAADQSNQDMMTTSSSSSSNNPGSISQAHSSERRVTASAPVDNTTVQIQQQPSASTVPIAKPIENVNVIHSSYGSVAPTIFDDISPKVEPPSVALFRLEKVSELLQRCSVARSSSEPLGFVNSVILRKVLSRWIMRAAHESSEYLDFIIPSWIDFEKLSTFFHRQLISETRKEGRDGLPGTRMLSMEALKEAGTSLAVLCHSLARDVALFRRRVEEPLPIGWNDTSIGMTIAEIAGNSNDSTIVINWAGQSQVTFPRSLFTQLRGRYQGDQSRLLTSMFTAKISYSTRDLLIGDTGMGLHLMPSTRSMLSVGLSVTGEVWSNPFTVLSGNHFWGLFAEIDTKFGGFKPFGTYDRTDDILMRDGGSVSVLVPPDSMLASGYIRRIIDLLEYGEQARVPLSFAVFLRSECLVDPKSSPSVDDFLTLDPRLRERETLICKIGRLPKGKHFFFDENQRMERPSGTDSLFMLLQNSAGREKFAVDDTTVLAILQSTDSSTIQQPISNSTFGSSLRYSGESNNTSNNNPTFIPDEPFGRNVHPQLSASPVPNYPPVASDFGAFGNAPTSAVANPFASTSNPSPGGQRRVPSRRGRLFDLVDDGDEDAGNDVDVVSGMLGNLNVDLFQNSSANQDVDIEAISLMGIGGPNNGLQHSRRTHGRFG